MVTFYVWPPDWRVYTIALKYLGTSKLGTTKQRTLQNLQKNYLRSFTWSIQAGIMRNYQNWMQPGRYLCNDNTQQLAKSGGYLLIPIIHGSLVILDAKAENSTNHNLDPCIQRVHILVIIKGWGNFVQSRINHPWYRKNLLDKVIAIRQHFEEYFISLINIDVDNDKYIENRFVWVPATVIKKQHYNP